MRKLLLCPPEHYGIEYEINPWSRRRLQMPDAVFAAEELNPRYFFINSARDAV